jgi:hypothetical protein
VRNIGAGPTWDIFYKLDSVEHTGSDSSRPVNLNYHAHVSGISNDGIGEMLDAHGEKVFSMYADNCGAGMRL